MRKGAIFKCTKNDLCEARFLRYENLERHMMADACMRYTKKRNESMFDLVTRTYIGEFGGASLAAARERGDESDSVLRFVDLPSASLDKKFDKFLLDYQPLIETLEPGFALPSKRGHTRMNEKQINYLKEQFDGGLEPTQRHSKPEQVMIQMRREKDASGKLLFTMEEWLSASQIKSKFSQFFKHQKSSKQLRESVKANSTVEEIEDDAVNEMNALTEASDLDNMRKEIEDKCLQDNLEEHPLQFNGIVICDLAKSIKLQKRSEPSSLDQILPSDIFKVLDAIGSTVPSQEEHLQKKKVKKEIENAITEFVEETCWCLNFL